MKVLDTLNKQLTDTFKAQCQHWNLMVIVSFQIIVSFLPLMVVCCHYTLTMNENALLSIVGATKMAKVISPVYVISVFQEGPCPL